MDVVFGRGMLTAGEREYSAEPGSILFVVKETPHRIHTIEEDLHVLVFFALPHTEWHRYAIL